MMPEAGDRVADDSAQTLLDVAAPARPLLSYDELTDARCGARFVLCVLVQRSDLRHTCAAGRRPELYRAVGTPKLCESLRPNFTV